MAGKKRGVGADIRMSALLVSALVKASDSELASLAEKRSLEIEVADLQRVRDLIREMTLLLKAPSDERWEHVHTAHDAILGVEEAEEPPARDEETTGEEEDAQPNPAASIADIDLDRPPSLDQMLGKPPAEASIGGDFGPSPWTEPSRAAGARSASSAPIMPPPMSEPVPPAYFVPNAMDSSPPASMPQPVTDTTTGGSDTERPAPEDLLSEPPPEEEEHEVKHKTLPPTPIDDQALPFPSAGPATEAPDPKSLVPSALASVTAGLPPMTIVSYAALCASCQALPQRVAETHAKFGVTDDAARQALDAVWMAKLEEDERLRVLWTALQEQFRGWLVQLR